MFIGSIKPETRRSLTGSTGRLALLSTLLMGVSATSVLAQAAPPAQSVQVSEAAQTAQTGSSGTDPQPTASPPLSASSTAPANGPPSTPNQQPGAGARVGEIVVTGSRIKRAGFDTMQPAIVVSSQAISERGATDVATVLNEQPAFAAPGNSSAGNQGSTSVGQNFVNFLGLGSQRTLVLVNGQRFPGSNSPAAGGVQPGLQVDLNTIPTALIDRVETIAVGGAPIYGADAIAGTVNIILKKDFTGFDSTLQAGTTEAGGAGHYRAQAMWGVNFDNDRGNLVLNAEIDHQNGLTQAQREETNIQYSFEAPAPGSNSPYLNVMIPNSRVVVTNFNGFPLINSGSFNVFGGGVRDANGNLTQFTPQGTLVPYNLGTPSGSPVFYSGGDGLNLAPVTNLLTTSQRYYADAFLTYKLTDHVKFHGEAWYSRSEQTSVANQPTYNAVAFETPDYTDARPVQGPVAVALSNPFLDPSAAALIASQTGGKTMIDYGDGLGPRPGFYVDRGWANVFAGNPFYGTTNLYRAVGQFSGDFDALGKNWDWDATYTYGRTDTSTRQLTFLENQFIQAIDSTRAADGSIVCVNPSNGCVPLNPFGNGPVSSAVRNFVTADETTLTTIQQHVASANITGSPFSLPAGKVGFAAGVEYRYESSQFTPDFLSASNLTPNSPLTAVGGHFSTKEVYAETTLPILSPEMNIPLVHSFEIEGAVRYVDNSSSGGDITYTGGARYTPVRDLEIRGNFTHSIRSPAITELFLPTAQLAMFANDPCDSRFITQGSNPAVRAKNCAAAGITQPFQSIIVNASQLGTQSGNPNLKNEQADAWTVGAVMRPRFLPGFTMSADWINIALTNAIVSLDATTILDACYDSTSYPSADVCHDFTRTATGQVANLHTGYQNAGLLNFSGLTTDATYRLNIGDFGALNFNLSYLYTNDYELSVTGSDFTQYAGEIGYSKHRATGSVAWTWQPWRIFLEGQYIGSAKFNNTDQPNTRDIKGLGDWVVFNTSIAYRLTPNLDIQLNIDNLTGNPAPKYVSAGGDIAVATYLEGILGRSYSLQLRAHF